MAGAGCPWYMPCLWPAAHCYTAIARPEKPAEPHATGVLDLSGHLTSVVAALRSFGLACLAWYCLPNALETGEAATLSFSWMWPIILRDVLACWLIAGFWDWLLYFSPLKGRFAPYKLNPEYPTTRQILHDAFWSTSSSISAAGLEIMMLHLWATGRVSYAPTLQSQPLLVNLFWVLCVTHWRIPHFHAMHRMMHPWFTTRIPDVGKFLYNWVHSLHHLSRNPTAFSGTSMHPVEGTLYYTAALLPCLFGAHPTIFLACIVDCGVGAWLGHDGFQWPGSGDYFHQIHHQWYDCNYGAMHVPLDKLFGTFKDKPIPGAVYDASPRGRSVGGAKLD